MCGERFIHIRISWMISKKCYFGIAYNFSILVKFQFAVISRFFVKCKESIFRLYRSLYDIH